MNNYNDTYYSTPNTTDFYKDCILHAIYFNLDRMPDDSWCRHSSDQPLEWILDNLDKITTHFLIIRRHTLDELNERWGKSEHLEVNFELRDAQSTYIFSAEIDFQYLDYFIEKYQLLQD
ncbi:MAG: hypothetical protein LBO74_15795 [Candidatus Symbiothrix sp.]|jgi:hypothetical protein|nr:hypothetical protein [Candidatus Symbiothrix sp.]